MFRQALSSLARPLTRQSTALPARRYASHGPSYNLPSGNLFGEPPLKKGEKRKWETWEGIIYVGYIGTMLVGAVLYQYKPDTSIQTWAMNEAKQRLEARGEAYQYKPKSEATASEDL